jgi:hypothetical protein
MSLFSFLEGKSIDLDLTPKDAPMAQTAQINSKEDYDRYKKWTASFADKAYFFIDVWHFGSAFSVFIFDDKGYRGHVERLNKEDQYALGITDYMIEEAVRDSGGSLTVSGHYPISEAIRNKLAEVL